MKSIGISNQWALNGIEIYVDRNGLDVSHHVDDCSQTFTKWSHWLYNIPSDEHTYMRTHYTAVVCTNY